jgi:anti-anti-sigma regulatory factor
MQITISKEQGKVPVTVIKPHGDVDASNYRDIVVKAEELFGAGARDFLIDLSDVGYMSSAGMVALHSIALLARGEKPSDPEAGWSALKSFDRARERGIVEHVKLLGPQQYVAETLDKAGFTQFFEVFTDLKKAVASY